LLDHVIDYVYVNFKDLSQSVQEREATVTLGHLLERKKKRERARSQLRQTIGFNFPKAKKGKETVLEGRG